MRTEDDDDSSQSGGGSSNDGEEEEEEVEWMVTSRQKRTTAGNRLTSLLQQEEPDDDLELLFAEEEDDAGFEDVEADSDVQMDSSEDEDDQGPAAGADDLEGEKELQRQSKVERMAKKKKMNDGIPKIFKKKVKIDPTATAGPAPRPKRKSERASWIPTAEEAPTRASARGTTRQSKEQLHAQMVDREIKRLKQLANMEKAAAAKEAAKKPAMTQADRLAEAARVEKSNSKSLSRWEEAEQQREEEQRLKLAALSNRHLEGPVITWWSGLATWVGGKLTQVGKKKIAMEEPKEKAKKRKAAEMEAEPESGPSSNPADISGPDPSTGDAVSLKHMSSTSLGPLAARPADGIPSSGNSPVPPSSTNEAPIPTPIPESAPQNDTVVVQPSSAVNNPPLLQPAQSVNTSPLSHGILQPPQPINKAPKSTGFLQPPQPYNNPPPGSNVLQHPHHAIPPPNNGVLRPPAPFIGGSLTPNISHPPFVLAPPGPPPGLDGSIPLPGFNPPLTNQTPRLTSSQTTPQTTTTPQNPSPSNPPPPPAPPAIEQATRNCLILANFDETAIKSKDVQTQILFNQTFHKIQSMPFSLSNPKLQIYFSLLP